MRAKLLEREEAIALRRQGLSYSEIRRRVQVSKSSLSVWLRPVGLLEWQQQRLSERKLAAARSGARELHDRRLHRTRQVVEKALVEAQQYLRARDVDWLAGVVLYWAEGSKPKPWNHGQQFSFTNMDAATIVLMRRWLERYCDVKAEDVSYAFYIHLGADVRSAREFWLKRLGIDFGSLRVYFKKHNPSPRRRNIGSEYHGTMVMRVKKSAALNQRIDGWIQALVGHCGVV